MGEPIITEIGQTRGLNIVGEKLTILASGGQTGSYEIFHQAGQEGAGPPPHNHPWDEAFFVTKGEIEFGIAEHTAMARPGTLVHVPAGRFHWFRFGPGGGEMVSVTSREGASAMFTHFDAEIAPEAPDLGKLVEIAAAHGAHIPPPPG
jgi:quercetin dioxygenase-like cupin family protein